MELIPAEPPSDRTRSGGRWARSDPMLSGTIRGGPSAGGRALDLARASAPATSRATPSTPGVSTAPRAGEVDEALDDLAAAVAIAEEVGIVDDIGRGIRELGLGP